MLPAINRGSNKAQVIARINEFPLDLFYASETIRNDREVVEIAIRKDGKAIKYANHVLRAERDLCLIAVTSDGLALNYISPKLKNDEEIITTAISQNPRAIRYAKNITHAAIKSALNKHACAVVRYCAVCMTPANHSVLFNKETSLIGVTQDGLCLQNLPPEMRVDYDVVLAAVQQNGEAVGFALGDLRSNKDIAMAALKQHGSAYSFVDYSLRDDKELLMEALKTDGTCYLRYHQDPRISRFANDMDAILALLKLNPNHYGWYNIENNIKNATVGNKTLLQISVENENQHIAKNMAGTIVSAFEMDKSNRDFNEMKEIIAEHSGIPKSNIVLDIEPKIAIISTGKNKGKFGEIIKNTNKMCDVKLGDGSKKVIRIAKTSLLEYDPNPN